MTDIREHVEAAMERASLIIAKRENDPEYLKRETASEAYIRESAAKNRMAVLAGRGIPGKDARRLLCEMFDKTPALDAVAEFQKSGLTLLVLSGMRGCGKTFAASWAVSSRPDGMFLDVSRLVRVSKYDEAAMRPIETAGLLVIDDIGMEYADNKGHFLSFFDGLVNARYADELPLILTTNLTAANFRDRYGERVADRIREAGRFVELAGASLRSSPVTST